MDQIAGDPYPKVLLLLFHEVYAYMKAHPLSYSG